MSDEFAGADRHSKVLRLVIVVLFASFVGCTTLPERLERGRGSERDVREAILEHIESLIRTGSMSESDRALVAQFLSDRFEHESEVVLRSQILALAVQGRFDCAEVLLSRGARDPSHKLVRMTAVQLLRDYPLAPHRETLLAVLRTERERLVRLEVAKTMGYANVSGAEADAWAIPLVEVFLDLTEDPNVRTLAHASAVRLTGEERPLADVGGWQEWLDSKR